MHAIMFPQLVALLTVLFTYTINLTAGEHFCNKDIIQPVAEVYPSLADSIMETNFTNSTSLYFGLMVAPSEDSDYLNSTVSAVQLALDTINAEPDLLGGYTLHYTLTTFQCSEKEIVDKTVNQLFGTQDVCKYAIIEAGCTDGRESHLRTYWVNHFNIPQITCSRTFQNDGLELFEMVPTSDVVVPAIVELIHHYKWKKVALVVEDRQESAKLIKALGHLESLNVTLTITTLTVENHTLKVECNSLFSNDTRIYILRITPTVAKHLLCQAFILDIKYPKYEFIFVSDHHSDWWVGSPQDDSHYGCSTEQRAQVLNHSLALQWSLKNTNNKLSNQTYINFSNTAELFKNGNNVAADSQALFCYDAVWTIALALNKTFTVNKRFNECQTMQQLFYENIRQTTFIGLTGKVEFENDGKRYHSDTTIFIQQYRNKSRNLTIFRVGSYTDSGLVLLNDTVIWPGGVPYDGSPVHVLVAVSVPLFVVYYSLATVGIVFAIICCVFNVAFRRKKVVRLTSPNLNYLLITGSVLTYTSTYTFCLPSVNSTVILVKCCIQIWLVSVGFTLTAGTIFAKLWRIYYIFRNPESAKNKTITDCHLLIFVFILAVIMMIITAVYVIVEIALPGYDLEQVSSADHPSEFVGDFEVDTHYGFYNCSRVPYARITLSVVIVIKIGLLLLGSLYMAFKTRKIQIKGLNDAKYISALVYISTLSEVAIVIVSFTLRSHVNTFPAVLSGIYMFLATICLSLIFIPKMIDLYRDPEGNHILDTTSQLSKIKTCTSQQ